MKIENLAGLSKPVTKLIEVVSQGIGVLYRPKAIIDEAEANAKASLIAAEADIQVRELWHRAAHRLVHTEVQRQKNLEAIIEEAKLALPERVSEEPVSKPWTTHFFDAAQDVSEPELRQIWARILAGEVAEPGSTCRRTLQFLKTLGKEEAEMFSLLLSVSLVNTSGWRFLIHSGAVMEQLREVAGDTDVVRHMSDIGLLSDESTAEAVEGNGLFFSYGNLSYCFEFPGRNEVGLGKHKLEIPQPVYTLSVFSAIGQELSLVAPHELHDNFVGRVVASMQQELRLHIKVSTEPTKTG